MVSKSLVFGYNFKTSQSMKNVNKQKADAVNTLRTPLFGSEGLILEGALDGVQIQMTDELGNVNKQGSLVIEYVRSNDAGDTSTLLQIAASQASASGINLFHFQPGVNDDLFVRILNSVTPVASFNVDQAEFGITRRTALRWKVDAPNRVNASFDGVIQSEDTAVPNMNFEDQIIYLGCEGITPPVNSAADWDGTIALLYVYDTDDGGADGPTPGDPDGWLDVISDPEYIEQKGKAPPKKIKVKNHKPGPSEAVAREIEEANQALVRDLNNFAGTVDALSNQLNADATVDSTNYPLTGERFLE